MALLIAKPQWLSIHARRTLSWVAHRLLSEIRVEFVSRPIAFSDICFVAMAGHANHHMVSSRQ